MPRKFETLYYQAQETKKLATTSSLKKTSELCKFRNQAFCIKSKKKKKRF